MLQLQNCDVHLRVYSEAFGSKADDNLKGMYVPVGMPVDYSQPRVSPFSKIYIQFKYPSRSQTLLLLHTT